MAHKNRNTIKKYHTVLTRKRIPIICPYSQCENSVIVHQYERHCTEHHSLNSKLCCVWCEGAVSWQAGFKCHYADHLLTCMKRFIALHRIVAKTPEPEPDPTLLSHVSTQPKRMNLLPLSEAGTLFLFADGAVSKVDHAFEHFKVLDTRPPLLQYPCPHTNLALSYLTSYLETRETHDWIHVMIKLVAYPSFVRALIEDEGGTRTLRFSCWCDGGLYRAERHRQHRHLILTAPRGHFWKHFWKKVKMEDPKDKPDSNFCCKVAKTIQNPLHFINTLGYVSHRKSQCKFSFREEAQEAGPLYHHHFYIFTSLPVDYRIILAGCWEGGLSQLLFMERFQNISVPRLTGRPVVFEQGQWKQKIKYFYNLPLGQVLPVEKRFVPTTHATPYAYHLLQGRVLYFESDPEHEALSEEEWLQKQVAGGNCFYDVIGENFWTPRPRDQEKLNDLMPLLHRIETLETEVSSLKRKCEGMEEEIKKWKGEESPLTLKII